jgi:hypothetical protein
MSGAERQRRRRRRRRDGIIVVSVEVTLDLVEALVEARYLQASQADDKAEIEQALAALHARLCAYAQSNA